MHLDRNEIAALTEEYGGQWGMNHTRRLLKLIGIISEGQDYDTEAVWLAAHLHDWGAYPKWAVKDKDHAVRSAEVADTFLDERECPPELKEVVLTCIRLHHSGGSEACRESILLGDADALDFLGVVGILRDFSKNPRELRTAYEVTQKRRATLPGQLRLGKSRAIAATRVAQMDELLRRFEEDSWGCF